MSAGPDIALRDVAKRYGGLQAIQPTSLTLCAGVNVLLGTSGSGKSTLLRMMTGLVQPDSGEIAIGGQRLTPESLPALRRRMGYVIQDGGLFPHLTALDNVELAPRYFGLRRERIDRRVHELTALTRFPADALQRFPAQLSGGQRQRVSLMRALMLEPEVLFLDEPLGALDPMIRAELRADLREIFRALGNTVVLVTHDLVEAEVLAGRVVLMRDGRVVQDGTLPEFRSTPADPFVTRFIEAHGR